MCGVVPRGKVDTKQKWHDACADADRRREIIKRIIAERGWKNMSELHKILLEEYEIDVSRQTVYKDLDHISKEEDTSGREKVNLLSSYRRKMNEIDRTLKNCESPKEKIMWYKLWTQYSKDYSAILARMDAANNISGKPVEKETVNIRFD